MRTLTLRRARSDRPDEMTAAGYDEAKFLRIDGPLLILEDP